VAAVSDAGVVTAIGNGTTTITATAVGTSASGAAQVTVQQAVASVSVSPQDGNIEIGETVQLTATAEDSGGANVEGTSFTWSSSDMAVATVSSAGLVTGVSDGNVTITATSGGSNGTAPVTVTRADLEITNDQNLEGDITADEFSIPAGVTVTATGDLSIDATGEVQIFGNIVGDCVTLAIQGDTAVTVGGTLNNSCEVGGIGDSISVVADGELTLEDATIISSGDMEFSNDPTLSDDDFPEPGPGAASGRISGSGGPAKAGRGVPFTRVNRTTIRYKGGETGPNPADPGDDNSNGDGGDGDDGRNVRFRLRGNAEFAGETILNGQSGGWGGDGTKTGNTDVEVKGGKGGDAGRIRIWVTGTLAYMGNDNVVRSGNGGDGGHATATGTTNPEPSKAPSAEAMGGKGGEPGLIDIRAGGGITVDPGALTLEIGRPGHGGDADATGADGVDATATKSAQEGGDATADGGVGGTTPDKQLQKLGNVTGTPIIQGINGAPLKAGNGGAATATAGDGGDSAVEPNPHGGDGGSPGASAGTGGEYRLKGLDGMLLGDGGDGGKATFRKGNGGDGWDDCEDLNNPKPGGNGGKGGDATGQDGDGGEGKAKGTPGGVEIENVGNGGDGMREDGLLGPNGTDATNNFGGKNLVGTNFQPGQPGGKCPTAPPLTSFMQLNQILHSSGLVEFGQYVVDLVNDAAEAIGQAVIATFGTAGNHYFGADPDRVGTWSTNGWDLILPEFVVGTSPFNVEEVEICLINTTVDEMNPATLEQIDGEGQVIDTYFWTSLASPEQRPGPSMMSMNTGCVTRQVMIEARIIRVRGVPGRFADFRLFRVTGRPYNN
jgi:hypothetical protein